MTGLAYGLVVRGNFWSFYLQFPAKSRVDIITAGLVGVAVDRQEVIFVVCI